MFDTLTLQENGELWSKLIRANRKFRRHAEYLIDLADRTGKYAHAEVTGYLDMASEQHDSIDELTAVMRTAV